MSQPKIRSRPTVLDSLPMVLITHFINPSLDYESRINLNQCLPPWDRVSRKMPKDSIILHDINIRISVLSSLVDKLDAKIWDWGPRNAINGNPRILLFIKIYRLFLNPMYFVIISHFPTFRNAIIDKADEFELRINMIRQEFSERNVRKFISAIHDFRNKLITNSHLLSNTNFDLKPIKPLTFV